MENAPVVSEETEIVSRDNTESLEIAAPHRRVGFFGILGRFLLAVAVIAGAAYAISNSVNNKSEGVQRQARERSFTVAVEEIVKGTFSPSIRAYGEIIAANMIDIRAQVSGTATGVSDNLAVGGHVSAGERLVLIDPFNYEIAILDARAGLADAQIQLRVAKEQLRIERVNLDVAENQLELASRDLERGQALVNQGSVTNKVVEDRTFLVTQRRQSVTQHESNISVQEAGMQRQETDILRAQANIQLAQRALANTAILAPFDAVVVQANVVRGRVVSQNEVVAQMYERDALDVRFVLSDKQYGQLVNAGLVGRTIVAMWDIDPVPLRATGKVTRAGAQVNAALGGVEVFARLSGEGIENFRSGAFVSVEVDGLEYADAFQVPETAIYENNHLYVVREDRMSRIDLTILSRDGANVIISADIAADDRVILTRVAQAGEGLKVRIEGEAPAFGGPSGPGGGNRPGNADGAAGNRGQGGRPGADGNSGANGNGSAGERPQRGDGQGPAAGRGAGGPESGGPGSGGPGNGGPRSGGPRAGAAAPGGN